MSASSPASFTDCAEAQVLSRQSELERQHLANMLRWCAALVHLGILLLDSPAAEVSRRMCEKSQAREPAGILWAFATLRHPNLLLAAAIAGKVVGTLNSQAVANSLWECAVLRAEQRPTIEAPGSTGSRLVCLSEMEPQHLASRV